VGLRQNDFALRALSAPETPERLRRDAAEARGNSPET
jgi:hypothetical protein